MQLDPDPEWHQIKNLNRISIKIVRIRNCGFNRTFDSHWGWGGGVGSWSCSFSEQYPGGPVMH